MTIAAINSVVADVMLMAELHGLLALDEQTEATLPRLVQRELALPRHEAELDGLREYAFKHAILHQVTYGTVLKRQRKLLHGKLAHWLKEQDYGVLLAAGDTFRAAAIEQLETWATRIGVPLRSAAP